MRFSFNKGMIASRISILGLVGGCWWCGASYYMHIVYKKISIVFKKSSVVRMYRFTNGKWCFMLSSCVFVGSGMNRVSPSYLLLAFAMRYSRPVSQTRASELGFLAWGTARSWRKGGDGLMLSMNSSIRPLGLMRGGV